MIDQEILIGKDRMEKKDLEGILSAIVELNELLSNNPSCQSKYSLSQYGERIKELYRLEYKLISLITKKKEKEND